MLHIPEVLTRAQVAAMRSALEQADWTDGRATVGAQGAQVKHNRQLPETSKLALELGSVVTAALAANPLYFAAALPLRAVPPLFNRYAGGEHYGAHIDGAVRIVGASALTVPSALPSAFPSAFPSALRTDLSCTLFLSDPDDYDGGELIINDSYGTHDVKLAAGDMILYPASSVHRVEPVTRGERICAFFWVQSMVRDNARRAMLLELDQNIQSLRARIGDCQELVSLTGHYHNLLRQWADV